ncbi:hypothetical protein N4G41_04105 [Kosakonia sacchari]|uniref:hypothetical protein n=1 Tax=Kosakonia sacchari TaxID=1158459 RepID=UPI002ACE629A|nr:hypothetical protein [Kosakonia sacchari]MDZ7320813.1 hypothetical protein [Kosakonia sacchari]
MNRILLFPILIFFIAPPLFAAQQRSQHDVESDNSALTLLHNTIAEMIQNESGQELEKIADKFPLTNYTDFTISTEASIKTIKKPSTKISNDEWQAFINTNFSADSENGEVNCKLVDLDGDGERDLIINSYSGGTGLFSYTGVLKRVGDKFVDINNNAEDDTQVITGALYSENGRGANQWGQWVRINDQAYALWFNGEYDEDTFYLLRPFNTDIKIPSITIYYHYEYGSFSIKSQDEGKQLNPALNDHDKEQLINSLNNKKYYLKKQKEEQEQEPICPVPAGTSSEDAAHYKTEIAGSYLTQPVAVIPVWLNGTCFIGSLESYFGRGELMTISSPKDLNILGTYSITGLRHIKSIKSEWKSREENIPL